MIMIATTGRAFQGKRAWLTKCGSACKELWNLQCESSCTLVGLHHMYCKPWVARIGIEISCTILAHVESLFVIVHILR